MLAPSPYDAEEERLAAAIMMATGSLKAPNTFKRYTPDWAAFEQWCGERRPPRQSIPADASTVALFLQSVFERAQRERLSYMVVKGASAAIFCAHELALVPLQDNPTKSAMAKAVRGAAKRTLGVAKRNQKDPLDWDTIELVVLTFAPLGACTTQALTVGTMAAVMFAGFFRYSDATAILCDETKFFDDHMAVFLEKRKTDQLREGDVVLISRGRDTHTCPVYLTQRLIAKLGGASHLPLFRGFDGRKSLSDPSVTMYDAAMSYDQCRRLTLSAIAKVMKSDVATVQKTFGTQSMRSGGATAVATKVDARVFQRHGSWKTASARDGYVRDSTETKLSVTRAIYPQP
jgi:hypothetical protein